MDDHLRLQVLRACVRDRLFLKSYLKAVDPEYFLDPAENIVATVATDFWEKYTEPIGAFLRSHAEDVALERKLPNSEKRKLQELINTIQGAKMELVSVKALGDYVKKLKKSAFYENAVEEIITAHEQGKFTSDTLSILVDKATRELKEGTLTIRDYFDEIGPRTERRKHDKETQYPKLGINPLDKRTKGIARGQVGLWLAPYASGKGMALCHLSINYASRGYKVIHLTLEDQIKEVENRMDANITKRSIKNLPKLPVNVRNDFKEKRSMYSGAIKIVDGTEGGWTITRIERLWHELRHEGFIADVIVIDYDDELECEVKFKGESYRRMEFAEIYRRMRRMAAKLDVMVWTAAQGIRSSERKQIITGKDAAEDISKIRKVWMAIGIGKYKSPMLKEHHYLYVIRHRSADDRFGVDIVSDYGKGVFYNHRKTLEFMENKFKVAEAQKERDKQKDD